MKLETLKDMKPTRINGGRPSSMLTDKEWQNQFLIMKLYVKPFDKSVTKLNGKGSRETGMEQTNYDGVTNWQSYCSYINDVLKNIRKGNHDFCYFGYQIVDLLKFHYDTLRTRYCDGYWEVWLEN